MGINELTPSDFSNVNIYTPPDKPGNASSQEYLTYSPITTPETTTLALAAVGLAAIGFAVRPRRRVAPACTGAKSAVADDRLP